MDTDEHHIQLSKNTSCCYKLLHMADGYAISCVEYDRLGNIVDSCTVRDITINRNVARDMFNKIVSNKVCACTLCDVICDLLC
ncbi:MAG: hypothetical protein J6B45_03145 [Clostridia bacterium]|nr:hypothetical protein [Clostridia bacterium]